MRVALSATSWWLDDALANEGHVTAAAPLSGRVEADVAIIGGGFTGMWTALALKQRAPHLRICLLERDICGAGASSKNGGKVHGYWASLWSMSRDLGPDAALRIARAGTRAQDLLREFATAPGRDVWWREGGNLLVSAAPAQDSAIMRIAQTARTLGAPDSVKALTPPQVAEYCRSPVFRGGVFLEEGATVHPGRLARALRKAVIDAGVTLHEGTAVADLTAGNPSLLHCTTGEVMAREVVMATNVELARLPDLAPHISVFSSYALMSDPDPTALQRMGWSSEVGMADLRMFLHYFRKTADGRVLMGSGSGPISYGGRPDAPQLTGDAASAQRALVGLQRLLPDLARTGIAQVWGGAIDVAADRLPVIRTIPGTRHHYACGFSGHGVNPACLAGQVLASLVLQSKDDWASLPLVTRQLPRLPPEPFRSYGGRVVRRAILACEDAEEKGQRPSALARFGSAIPRMMGMRIGTR